MPAGSPSKNWTFGKNLAVVIFGLTFGLANTALADSTAVCRQLFADNSKPDAQRILNRIEELGPSSTIAPHEITIKDGKGYIKIGYLDYTQREYMLALRDAVKMGAIAEIDAGLVVGPKVLPWLLKIADFVPPEQPITITGELNPRILIKQIRDGSQIKNPTTLKERSKAFSEKEIQELSETAETLGINKACLKYYSTSDWLSGDCLLMTFRMKSNDPDAIDWKKWRRPNDI